MNKKLIFGLIVICVAIASISTVSAWWIFGGGNDVTVNDVSFHLPDGFDVENPVKSENDDSSEQSVFENTKTKDRVDIVVSNKVVDDSQVKNLLINKGFKEEKIAGKDGFYQMYLDKTIEFVYIDNDKVVSIVVPYIYDKYGDNFMQYDELLDEIIK